MGANISEVMTRLPADTFDPAIVFVQEIHGEGFHITPWNCSDYTDGTQIIFTGGGSHVSFKFTSDNALFEIDILFGGGDMYAW